MLFLVTAEHIPDAAELRKGLVAPHVAYLNRCKHQFVGSGPLLADEADTDLGMVLILDMPSRKDLDLFLQEEPYNKGGLLRSIEIRRWRFGSADTNRKDIITTEGSNP